MSRTQDVRDGVLVRPCETLATNFLSSRYYNGRQLVDLLDTPADWRRWGDTVHAEIGGPQPFTPTTGDLTDLRGLRDTLDSLYRETVEGRHSSDSVDDLNRRLDELTIRPRVTVDRAGSTVTRWAHGTRSHSTEFHAAVLVSALDTAIGPRSLALRKCHAPRCVLYFTQLDSRQHWCSNVCGNRARVARAASRATT